VNALAQTLVSQEQIATVISDYAERNRFPKQLNIKQGDTSIQGDIHYTFDPKIHHDLADVYLRYQPDYAAFVAMDPNTGAILNISSFIKQDEPLSNLVMRADYPAASIFKMITAAAGLDLNKLDVDTVIPYNGKSTSLYKKQVLSHKDNKWTRTPTLKESFAKSVNPVFGQIGVFHLGRSNLLDYAERFGFTKPMETDFHLPVSEIRLNLNDQWSVAEAASGYTRDITLSPIHAAQIASMVVNGGKKVTPYMVDKIVDEQGYVVYDHAESNRDVSEQVIAPTTAEKLKELMTATTKIGSARKSFAGINRYKVYKGMELGGKTGSLTGFSPKGRHDWFVGFAEKDGKQVAYASLIINKEKWYVRSAYVARQFVYNYFKNLEMEEEAVSSVANKHETLGSSIN
jgi:cell division protein FtsI/penicillin-binding protein 2